MEVLSINNIGKWMRISGNKEVRKIMLQWCNDNK